MRGRRGPGVGPIQVPGILATTSPPLARRAYRRDALRVARSLLGKILFLEGPDGVVAARICEVEAYRGPEDLAAHSSGGRRTPRNEVMWGPPGHAYVYFVYGMHWCLNAVTAPAGRPEAVLIRAAEPLLGLGLMRARRRTRDADARLLAGPARLCKAFGIDRRLNGADLVRGPLTIRDAPPVRSRNVLRTPRVGVDYAGTDALLPWRLLLRDSPSVSIPPRPTRGMQPRRGSSLRSGRRSGSSGTPRRARGR